MTVRLSPIALMCLVVVYAAPAAAKSDIRGVATGELLQDALENLDLDQARCGPVVPNTPVVCAYDEHTRMTLYSGTPAPSRVEKIVYDFRFKDLNATRLRLQKLYGLRRDDIEGEHQLATGERILVLLGEHGTGSLSITNDQQIRTDQE